MKIYLFAKTWTTHGFFQLWNFSKVMKLSKTQALRLPAISAISQTRHSGSHSNEKRCESSRIHVLRIDDSKDDGDEDPSSDDLVEKQGALGNQERDY